VNPREFLRHGLDCDKAWSEGYTAGFRSATQSIASMGPTALTPSSTSDASAEADHCKYFYDLGRGQGMMDAKSRP